MEYDVVVAGAGPAGSAVARDVAKAGFKVLLLEEDGVVGKPVRCAGLVSPRTVQLAGVGNGVVLNEIKGAVVHSASGKQLSIGGDKTYALVIDRAAFDAELAEQAQQCGADLFVGTKLLHIKRRNGFLHVHAGANSKSVAVEAKLVVGADGAHSNVASYLGVPAPRECVLAVTAEAKLAPDVADLVDVFVGTSVAPGWFGWLIPTGNGVVRIGSGSTDGKGNAPKQLLSYLVAAFPQQLKGVEFTAVRGGIIPLYSPRQTYGRNILLVGDAACQVKPTTGGGIYTGLVGAKHCARTAVRALEEEDFSEEFLSQYEAAWRGELGEEFQRGLDLRRVLMDLRDDEIDWLLTLFRRNGLQRIISKYGDIDYPSPLFGHLLKAAPLLRALVRIPIPLPSLWLPWLGE